MGALWLAWAGAAGAQALPDVKTPEVQCTVLAMALDIQADATLSAQEKAESERQMKDVLSLALRPEYDKLKVNLSGSLADAGMNRVAGVCAQVLHPPQEVEQIKRCGPSWRQVSRAAAMHKFGMSREAALSVAHAVLGAKDPNAADMKVVDFVYAYTPEAMREPDAMLRVPGAWLNQCLTATK